MGRHCGYDELGTPIIVLAPWVSPCVRGKKHAVVVEFRIPSVGEPILLLVNFINGLF